MSDLETLLREARLQQEKEPLAEPVVRQASLRPWGITAGVFVLIFLGIHFLWPVPAKRGLPFCGPTVTVSCQKP
ncbi:hypothetical protein [Gluconobacter wancherniae]|uniref:hypothetical protein n=1 Tax=Gluconobacter wancherniae TaxID=1307955 RepID=UPI0011BE6192|nr:hypothetical protein [Gluconobacter wancherniae]MBF0854880.1 hypothetical protein [Gluconobacter wancherniae]MBS1064029.1 hypothetical protein [Gluconobacter wancherniae]MBS1089457.1 hypothetical protein [Gluconobacter wancherniae]MBS1095577.1 hypothetical protein [Gluconobacter wancherniae]